MTRKLSGTVVSGGVIYPAGTPATADLEATITNPAHWSGKATEASTDAPASRKRAPKSTEPEDS